MKNIQMKNFSQLVCIAILTLFTTFQSVGQDANTLLQMMQKKFNVVQDYKADVTIHTDVSFIKSVPVNAYIYFKQPNKMQVESKGIAILPKQGPDFLFTELLNSDNFIAVDAGQLTYNGMQLRTIKLLPKVDTGDLVLATLHVDAASLLIYKTQITTKSRGTVDLQFTYGKYAAYMLPDKVVFEMDVNKFKIPKAIAADIETSNSAKKDKDKPAKRGKISITYKSYAINNGVEEKVFKKK